MTPCATPLRLRPCRCRPLHDTLIDNDIGSYRIAPDLGSCVVMAHAHGRVFPGLSLAVLIAPSCVAMLIVHRWPWGCLPRPLPFISLLSLVTLRSLTLRLRRARTRMNSRLACTPTASRSPRLSPRQAQGRLKGRVRHARLPATVYLRCASSAVYRVTHVLCHARCTSVCLRCITLYLSVPRVCHALAMRVSGTSLGTRGIALVAASCNRDRSATRARGIAIS